MNHDYPSELIKKLDLPTGRRVADGWQSTWEIRVRESDVTDAMAVLRQRLAAQGIHFALTSTAPNLLSLVLTTPSPPLDEEAFPMIDTALRVIDQACGIARINGSPRDDWRTFR